MPKGIPKGPVNRLDRKAARQLEDYIAAEYTASGLNDVAFTKMAEEHFQLPLTHSNISQARETMGILSNWTRQGARTKGDLAVLEGAILGLTHRLASLESRVEVYIKGCRGDVK